MKVEVKEIDEAKNSVLLECEGQQEWFVLADAVKMQYVRLGIAEATVDMIEKKCSYLKMEKSGFKKSSGFGKLKDKTFPKAEQEKKFYKTKHLVLSNMSDEELRIALDTACSNKWVIATQTHFVDGKWNAVIYYKVKPE